MRVDEDTPPFLGRHDEINRLRAGLSDTANGASTAVVIHGEPGVGKTALIDQVEGLAAAMRTVRIQGVESDAVLSYAGVQWLYSTLQGNDDLLPEPQRLALLTATGQIAGAAPSPFLVGLALLSVMASAAADRGLVCLIDDAQWLDSESAQVLAFVARRLDTERIVMVFGVRDEPTPVLSGIPEMRLSPLKSEDALELLRQHADAPLDPVVAGRIVLASGGNPLALVDLASDLTAAQLAGAERLPDEPIAGRLKRHYALLLDSLNVQARLWLLISAAERDGDAEYIARAAAYLSLPPTASASAETAGLVTVGAQVVFRHPLIRSAAYTNASSVDKSRVHRALAAVMVREPDADKRAWHLAFGVNGTDQAVSKTLEAAADRAHERGGYFSQAAFLTRAAELTDDAAEQRRLLLAAAEVSAMSGLLMQTANLVERLDYEAMADVCRGRVVMVSQALEIMDGTPRAAGRAASRALRAAALFAPEEPERAHDALLQAFAFAFASSHLTEGVTTADLSRLLRHACEDHHDHNTVQAMLLDALGAMVNGDLADAVPVVRAALGQLLSDSISPKELLQYAMLGHSLATAIWDNETAARLGDRAMAVARQTGAVQSQFSLMHIRSVEATEIGQLRLGDAYAAGADSLSKALGVSEARRIMMTNMELLAWRGDDDLDGLVEHVTTVARAIGLGAIEVLALNARSIRAISVCDYETAFHAHQAIRSRPHLTPIGRLTPDYIESAVFTGRRQIARGELSSLERLAVASPTPWLTGLVARTRAVLSDDDVAGGFFEAAVDALTGSDAVGELARTHLLYGEWLRRRRRRSPATLHLQRALSLFEDMGAPNFEHRASQELAALGVKTETSYDTVAEANLTARESAVAHLAMNGATNAEIASAMLISVNTVDYHMRKVFRKLGISSRRQLITAVTAYEIRS